MTIIFNQPETYWAIIGILLALFEFYFKGFISLLVAVGAGITSICTAFFNPQIEYQILLFIVSSAISLMFFRHRVMQYDLERRRDFEDDHSIKPEYIEEFKFMTGLTETDIKPGRTGLIKLDNRSYEAISEDYIKKGDLIKIVNFTNPILQVKILEKLDL